MRAILFLKGHAEKKVPLQMPYDDFDKEMEKLWVSKEFVLENGKRITISKTEIQAYYESHPTKPLTERGHRDNITIENGVLIDLTV